MKMILISIVLVVLTGCTTITYLDPVKNVEVRVEHFLVDPSIQGFEWVWSETNYVAVNKASSKVSSEATELIKLLIEHGIIVPPAL